MSIQSPNSELRSPSGSPASGEAGEVLIRAENVGKKFCRSLKKSLIYGVQDVGVDLKWLRRPAAENRIKRSEIGGQKSISS